MQQEDAEYRRDQFMELTEKRDEKWQRAVKEHNHELDRAGEMRYLKDKKQVEEYIEKLKSTEKEKGQETYLKLHASMDFTERKQREA